MSTALTGCWDRREIETIAIVRVVVVNQGEDSNIVYGYIHVIDKYSQVNPITFKARLKTADKRSGVDI